VKLAPVSNYPASLVPPDRVQPVPRRIRATLAGHTVFDTRRAVYVWEWPHYPQYYVPRADVADGILVPEGERQDGELAEFEMHGVQAGDVYRAGAARFAVASKIEEVRDTVRFEWAALDSWFEEDERVFVHPRNPYARVDALRSTRNVRVELHGVVLAQSSAPSLVFETGLPTRYYLNRTEVNFEHLRPSDTVTECPYKGITSGYWSVELAGEIHRDLAWTYDFPTRQLLPISGMIAFYNEKVDLIVDGRLLDRPLTHFGAARGE
jgi:uncharacterized protein (DUF427 family)